MYNTLRIIAVFLVATTTSFAQQWVDFNYPIDSITDVVYGSALDFNNNTVDLHLDIYHPVCNDPINTKPLILVVHGGGFIAGSYKDPSVRSICEDFAKRGYVAVSVQYRLGYICDEPNHQCNLDGYPCLFATDSLEWSRAYYRGVQDAKGALRYMINHKEQYQLDENNVFVMGESAGSFVAMGAVFMDDDTERPYGTTAQLAANAPHPNAVSTCGHNFGQTFTSTIDRPDLGGINGSIETVVGPYTVRAVGNIFGGMFNNLLTVDNHAVKPALYSFHQACDIIVPWDTRKIYYGLSWCLSNGYGCFGIQNTPFVHGTKTINDWNTNLSLGYDIQSETTPTPFPYEYIGFQPKNCADQVLNNQQCHAYDNRTLRLTNMAQFFASKMVNANICTGTNAIFTLENQAISIAPNPVENELRIKSSETLMRIQLYTTDGKELLHQILDQTEWVINFDSFQRGAYYLIITSEHGTYRHAVLKQ